MSKGITMLQPQVGHGKSGVERVWNSGPPPHIGWWNASMSRNPYVWRFWDGTGWRQSNSDPAGFVDGACVERLLHDIEWSDYYPENARVPRVDPSDPKNAPIVAFINAAKHGDKGWERTAWNMYRRLQTPAAAGSTRTVREMKERVIDCKRLKDSSIAMPDLGTPQPKRLNEFPGYQHLSATDRVMVDAAQVLRDQQPREPAPPGRMWVEGVSVPVPPGYVAGSTRRLSEAVRIGDADFSGAMGRNTTSRTGYGFRRTDTTVEPREHLRGRVVSNGQLTTAAGTVGDGHVGAQIPERRELASYNSLELMKELFRRFNATP